MPVSEKNRQTIEQNTTYKDIPVAELLQKGAHAAIYFIGIGGIGMSALARYFHAHGLKVGGYDKTETELTRRLVAEGISVNYSDDVESVDKHADLVVYTPAVPAQHVGLSYYKNNGYLVAKRSDVLQAISAETFNVCVAGTHGKTSITTMISHLLRHTGYGCNAFLGGISVNYNTNFWSCPSSEGSDDEATVIEADEYDRSFHKLSPDIAIISSIDADHLDIYGTEEAMQDAFVEFGNKIKPGGILIHKFGLKRVNEVKVETRQSYSLQNDAAHYHGANIQIKEGGYTFDVVAPGNMYRNLHLQVGGMHNVENMIAAIAVADKLEIEPEKIKEAVAAFKGVKRRFEYILPPENTPAGAFVKPVLIDDYAHHPEELKALIGSVRTLFPQRLVTVIFQPHLFSRTKDHAEGFAKVLSDADRLILLPIYPARELPMEGVSSELILEKLDVPEKLLLPKEELAGWMEKHIKQLNKEFGEVLVVAGAGDIDTLVLPLKNILEKA